MKKWLILSIFIVVIIALVIYACYFLYLPKPIVFENITPNNAVYYISTSNLNKKIQDIKNSDFYAKLSETSLYKARIAPALEYFNSKAPFLKNFMDKDIALAVFSLDRTIDLKIKEKLSVDFLLLIRIDKNKLPQFKRTIIETYFIKNKGGLTSEEYQGVKISSFKPVDWEKAVNYAILSDTVVISNSLANIRKSIDLFRNKNKQCLANNADFRKVISKIKKDSLLWGYKNSKNYYVEYLRHLDVKSQIIMSQMESAMNLAEVIKDSSFYIDYDKQIMAFILKSYLMVDTSKDKNGFINVILKNKAIEQRTLSLIPKDVTAYCINSQDMLKYWDFLMNFLSSFTPPAHQEAAGPESSFNRLRAAASSKNAINQVESFLGINLKEDLIALLGDNFGVVLASIDEVKIPVSAKSPQKISQHILFPQLYFFFELKDKAKFEKVMELMVRKIADDINSKAEKSMQLYKKAHPTATVEKEKLPITLLVESYRNVDIHYLQLADFPPPFIEPNYCIIDNYFVFSISKVLTKKIIETYKSSEKSFTFNADFVSFKNNIPTEYSGIVFIDFQDAIKNVVQSGPFKDFHRNLAANPMPGFSNSVLDSFLGGLSVLNKLFFTTNKVPGEDMLESQILLTLARIDPNDVKAFYNQASVHDDKGDRSQVISNYSKAIELNPNDADPYYIRGINYRETGNLDKAIEDLSKYIEINPQLADAYYERGLAYKDKKLFDNAISDFTKVLELRPNDGDAYNSRGFNYMSRGDFDKAIIDFNKAIEINPGDWLAYNNRGVTYSRKNEPELADSDYTKSIEVNPKYAKPYNNKGSIYYTKKNFRQALAAYNKAIELDADFYEAYVGRADVYKAIGDFHSAMLDFDKAMEINPKNAWAYYKRADMYLDNNDTDLAIKDFNKALEIDPNDPENLSDRARAYVKKGEITKAISDCNKAIEINPKLYRAYNILGDIYYHQDNYDKALFNYNKALEINPKLPNAYYNRGRVYAQKNEKNRALSEYNKAINVDPDFTLALISEAHVYFSENDFEKAIYYYSKAIEKQPDYDALYHRAKVYKFQNKPDKALLDYNKLLEMDKNNAEIYNLRAIAYFDIKDYDKSWEDVQKALALGYKVDPGFVENAKGLVKMKKLNKLPF